MSCTAGEEQNVAAKTKYIARRTVQHARLILTLM